jgi:hypothetical protein
MIPPCGRNEASADRENDMDHETTKATCGLGGCLGILLFNLALGGVCFDYVLATTIGKDVPWYADAVAGLFLGQFAVPAAIICWIIKLCGIDVPLFQV